VIKLFFQRLYDKGIKLVEHLFDFRFKTFYSFQEIKYLYDIAENQLYKYTQLIHSIPQYIKQQLCQKDIRHQVNNNNNALIEKIT